MAKRLKVRVEHVRDFWAYVRWRRSIDRSFLPWQAPNFERGRANTILCFAEIDARGKFSEPPREPRLLRTVLEGKKLLNFQIRQWAEGFQEVPRAEIREAYPWLPAWVFQAILCQAVKSFGGAL